MKHVLLPLLFTVAPLSAWSEFSLTSVRYQPLVVQLEAFSSIAQDLEPRLEAPVQVQVIEFDEVDAYLLNTRPGQFIELPSQLATQAFDADWLPVMVYDTPVRLGIYRNPEGTGPVTRLATPPQQSLAAAAARVLMPDAEYFERDTHTDCLRATFSDAIDGCLTAPFFVNQYQQRFDIELQVVTPPIDFPPPILFASPLTSSEVIKALQQTPLPILNNSFTYVAPANPTLEADYRSAYLATQ